MLEEEPDFLDFLARSEVAMDPEEAWDDGEWVDAVVVGFYGVVWILVVETEPHVKVLKRTDSHRVRISKVILQVKLIPYLIRRNLAIQQSFKYSPDVDIM